MELALPLGLKAAETALSAAGTIAGGRAAQHAARAQSDALEFRARQAETGAQQARALAGRAAQDKRREARLLQSKLQARAAASGGASDPGVVNLAEDIAGSGEYEAGMERYKGEERGRALEDQAAGHRYAGAAAMADAENKRKRTRLAAWRTIIGGANSMRRTAGSFEF